MSSRLDQRFATTKRGGRSALVAYVMATLVVLCAPAVAQETPEVLLPGLLDVALIEGSHVPGDCSSAAPDSPPTTCVAFPRESERDWQAEYVRALRQAGWRFTGGAGPVFWFERPINDGECSQRLDMLGWMLGDATEMAKLGTDDEPNIDWSKVPYGLFIFTVAREPVCGNARHTQ
jgi:hypothetical protein